jgi:hypothetical protein
MLRLAGIIFFASGLLSCQRSERTVQTLAPVADSVYIRQADRLISATFDTLRNSLVKAIGEGGFDHAVEFCNENANALTNAYVDSVSIKRISLLSRNSNNTPDSLGKGILTKWAAAEKPLSGELVRLDAVGEIRYFKPIMTQGMCLNCHGKPGESIKAATLDRIKQKYPNDKAINYEDGDLRGAWQVTFRNR